MRVHGDPLDLAERVRDTMFAVLRATPRSVISSTIVSGT